MPAIALTTGVLATGDALASSHREALMATGNPKLDWCGFYMFNSYETGRSNFVTVVAVFFPLALWSRRLLFYQRFILRLGSAAIISVASTSPAERVLDFKWLPF